MRKLILILLCISFVNICQGQVPNKSNDENIIKIKKTIINFLKWYKSQQVIKPIKKIDTTKLYSSIIVWKQTDNLIKPSIDMIAVEDYLRWLRESGFISETFINNLRQYHQKIADELKIVSPTPKSEGFYAIPDLNLDVVFLNFEPEEILEHYKAGLFKRTSIVHNKAVVQFYVPPSYNYGYTKMLYTLTKDKGIWLIDYIGYYD